MRLVTKLVILGGAAYGAKVAYDKYIAAGAQSDDMAASGAASTPAYADKSFGSALNEDQVFVDRLEPGE